jgi:hypothetical protein
MQGQDSEALSRRLNALELRWRVTTAAWAVSVIAFGVLGIWPQRAASQSDVIRARRIEVVDASGKLRILIETNNCGSELWMQDDTGRRSVQLVACSGGSGSSFQATGIGRSDVLLGILVDGTPVLLMRDSKGTTIFSR